MSRKYVGWVEFFSPQNNENGHPTAERIFSKPVEVKAESVTDAIGRIEAFANARKWRARRDRQEVRQINRVHTVEAVPKRFFAFRYEKEGGYTTSRLRGYWRASLDHMPGQLWFSWSRAKRNEWVAKGVIEGEIRKPVRANQLPKGWYPDNALCLDGCEAPRTTTPAAQGTAGPLLRRLGRARDTTSR